MGIFTVWRRRPPLLLCCGAHVALHLARLVELCLRNQTIVLTMIIIQEADVVNLWVIGQILQNAWALL